jgi:periplasmic protein TonB
VLTQNEFKNNIFANTLEVPWTDRARRGSTLLTSFGLQALVVSILLLSPLLRPVGFPSFHQLSTPISLAPTLGEAPVSRAHSTSHAVSLVPMDNVLRTPTHIPSSPITPADAGPPAIDNPGAYAGPGNGDGDPRGLPNLFSSGSRPIVPSPPPPVIHTIRLSHMSEGDLIRKVQPTYPALARAARIQGTVVLQATISKQGTIENLRALAGHPMLVQAAIEAVRQWRYRPYILNNEPVEVETQITVNFSLAGS